MAEVSLADLVADILEAGVASLATLSGGDNAAVFRAQLDDGRQQRFVGQYVVRRVNDVPGASADQLRWHIDSATLKPAAG